MNGYSILSIVVLVLFVGALYSLVFAFSVWSVIGFGFWGLMTYWVLGGCARNGDPVARRILNR